MELNQPLKNHFTESAFPFISSLLEPHALEVKIVKSRATKFGDFNPIPKKKKEIPVITLNDNLNPYHFLITFLHEFAHYLVWTDGHLYARPHGRMWKKHYSSLMNLAIGENLFPDSLLPSLIRHADNPAASSSGDIRLSKELTKFDKQPEEGIYVENLKDGSIFSTARHEIFRREKKLRKRVLCTHIKNRRKYLFSPVYRVFPMKNNQHLLVFPNVFIFLP